MKKILLLGIILTSTVKLLAADGDTVKINYFTNYDLQQWKGSWYHKKFDYLDPTKKYKKAYFSIKLGCASYGCCVWDYTFQAYIIKPLPGFDTSKYGKLDTVIGNSKTVVLDSLWINRKSDNYEIGRLITPYGTYMRANSNGFNNNTWQHPYIYDVTDYLPLIKDSFGVAVLSGGFDGKKGFNMTLDLILIEGESDYKPTLVSKPFSKNYTYKNELQIDSLTIPYKFKLAAGETNSKFRTIITGHGAQGEFSPIEYRVKLNGNQIFSKRLWKTDCDKTYIQPQGGTWIFSRCNWCPGEKIETFELDLTPYLSKIDSNEIDVSFGAIETTSPTIAANYIISGHLISYSKKDSYDISIDDIISPNSDPNYLLYNPACQGPIVRLRNNGTKNVKEAYIDYWVAQNSKSTYIWKGNLTPDQTIDVTLPAFPWIGVDYSTPIFYAKLQKTKENMTTWNDELKSSFKIPTVFNSSKLKFETKTTTDTKNNTLNLYNELGDVVMTKVYKNDGKTYTDTISLVDGCYRAELIDYDDQLECGDGLSFWWSTQQLGKTTGSFKILNGINNAVLKTFNPDFGGKINFQFTVNNKKIGEYTALSNYAYKEYVFPKDTIKTNIESTEKIQWTISPNPSLDSKFSIDFSKPQSQKLVIEIYDLYGRKLYSKLISGHLNKELISLDKYSKGEYIVRLIGDKFIDEKKLIIQ